MLANHEEKGNELLQQHSPPKKHLELPYRVHSKKAANVFSFLTVINNSSIFGFSGYVVFRNGLSGILFGRNKVVLAEGSEIYRSASIRV